LADFVRAPAQASIAILTRVECCVRLFPQETAD
jgi:hypothetical protein